MSLFSIAFDRALRLASIVHAKQKRKGTDIPYIAHPLHVARLLVLDGQPEPVVVAGVLHDVLEDFRAGDRETCARLGSVFPALQTTPDDPKAWERAVAELVEAEFGAETKRLVDAVTERKHEGRKPRPWKQRKLEQLHHLQQSDSQVAALKAADALHNVMSILGDVETTGGSVFSWFKASIDQTLWHYGTVAAVVVERLRGSASRLGAELEEATDRLTTAVEAVAGPREPCTGRWAMAEPLDHTQLVVLGADGLRRVHGVAQWPPRGGPGKGNARRKTTRSAMELARAWVGGVEPSAPLALQALLDGHEATSGATFATACAERETPDDELGTGRHHDLVLYGASGGRRLVVVIEARADEPFGSRIADVLGVASRTRTHRAATGRRPERLHEYLPQRLDRWSCLVFGRPVDEAIAGLRSHLLQGVAGAVLEAQQVGAQVAVFAVHEFVGPATRTDRLEANRADLDRFLLALGGGAGGPLEAGRLVGPIELGGAGTTQGGVPVYLGRATTLHDGVRS